jgi:hypothetical protein
MTELIESVLKPVDPSGRFRLLDASGLMSPAKCAVCGRGPRTDLEEPEKFVDPVSTEAEFVDGNFVFEFYGNVYFCKNCTLEMASLFGALQPEQARQLIEACALLLGQRDQLTLEKQELEAAQDALMAQLLRLRGDAVIAEPVNTLVSQPADEVTPNNADEIPTGLDEGEIAALIGVDVSQEPESTVISGEPTISESPDEQRRDDVLDVAGTESSESFTGAL